MHLLYLPCICHSLSLIPLPHTAQRDFFPRLPCDPNTTPAVSTVHSPQTDPDIPVLHSAKNPSSISAADDLPQLARAVAPTALRATSTSSSASASPSGQVIVKVTVGCSATTRSNEDTCCVLWPSQKERNNSLIKNALRPLTSPLYMQCWTLCPLRIMEITGR
ncbi:hypothetical protein BKA82DRAFT_600050 [Pisolithus tinctorius]|uniref:Uncharacterized protein n=1 Tax=Pisolithus tinctorius Marx 270 TaxID=870435 RepID=A0A0C3P8K7_PISTI|nr:hypothetical protein BKA82DRAFT_600050 [Pisolithus tinctorius]KIO04056.1 hypothetical protein M404DRAFT_600050 [Pisolithus tinctorius Marx 270]